MENALIDKIKGLFKKKEKKEKKVKEVDKNLHRVTVSIMEKKFESEDFVGAARDLKVLLEVYGRKKKQNHRYKGREFISFILSNKHKDLKNKGYMHWKNINQIIQLNKKKVYPYHQNNLKNAMTFFEKEIKAIYSIDVDVK